MPDSLLTRDNAQSLERREAISRPSTFNATTLTVDATVASATPVPRHDERGAFLEVLDAAGLDLEGSRGASVLDAHRQDGVGAILGTLDALRTAGSEVIGTLRLSARPELASTVEDIRTGIVSNVSVGYQVDEWRESVDAQGKRTKTAVRWRIREVSFVPVGADHTARTRALDTGRATINRAIRQLGERANLAQPVIDDLIDRQASIEDARAAVLDRFIQLGGASFMTAHNVQTLDNPANQTRAIEGALYARMTGTAPTDQARPFMHGTLIDLMRQSLAAGGQRLRDNSPAAVYEAAMSTRAGLHSTSDFPTILNNVMGKRLGELFKAAESGASAIVATGTARDFRPITEARTSSFPSLEPVGEGGEITWGTMDDEGEEAVIASFARAIGVTFQVIVNDDLGAIERGIRDISFATAQLKAKLIVAALGASLKDGNALFHSSHGNLASPATALADTSLEPAMLAMSKQTPPGSTDVLGLTPSILLVRNELDVKARKLLATINPTTTDDVNVFADRLTLRVEPRLATATEWYLFCAPTTYPTIRFLTLQGFEAPRFETNVEFNRLGSSYRVHWHVGAAPIDHRGAYKNAGAS